MAYHCSRRNKHPLPTSILFFKIILRTSLQDGKLMIPKKFTRKYGGDMSNPVFLKPPDGTEWEVFWTKNDGDIWLQKGWKEFAKYYSLDHGHMVLFEYKQTSQFEVRICDKSALQIEYPIHGSQDAHDNLDQISDDSVKISDELPSCHETRQKSPMSCPQPRKKLRTGTSGDVERRSTEQNLSQHVQIEEDMGGKTEQDNLDQIHDDLVKSLDEQPPCRLARQKAPMSCPQPCKAPMSCRQPCKRLRAGTSGDVERRSTLPKLPQHVQIKEEMDGTTECLKVQQLTSKNTEALRKATTFRSKNPAFTIVMKPSDVDQHCLVLDGGTWHCNYSLGTIVAGWKKFVADNNLKVGDVCVFELTKSRGFSLKVQIFRLAEEPHSPPVQGGKTTTFPFTNGALNEAKKFASENPFFTVNFCLGNKPYVPRPFIIEYFNKKTQIVKEL